MSTQQGNTTGHLVLKSGSSIKPIKSDNRTVEEGQKPPCLSDLMSQRAGGGTFHGVQIDAGRKRDTVVDAGEKEIAV